MNWSEYRLGRIARLRVSNVDKLSRDDEHPVRLCNYVDVYKNEAITSQLDFMQATASTSQIANFRLSAGDTVFTKDSETSDDIGVPAFVAEAPSDLICGYHLAIATPDTTQVHPRYLYWALSSAFVREQWTVLASGVTRVGLRSDDMAKAAVPLPPLDEQRRIADLLDIETTRLDSAVAVRRSQAALELERWRSLVANAVLGLDGRPTPLKRLFGSSFAGVWGTDPGTDLADVLCARVADFDRENYRVVDVPTVRSVSLLDARRKALRAGDILLEKSGGTHAKPVGCAVMYEGAPGAVSSNFVQVLRPRAGVAPRFAGYVMAALYETRANGAFVHQTTGIQNLDMASYLSTTVVLPDLSAQHTAVAALDHAREQVAAVRDALGRGTRLLAERRQALITAAVTGELDVTTARGG